jgi:hypothetical protein
MPAPCQKAVSIEIPQPQTGRHLVAQHAAVTSQQRLFKQGYFDIVTTDVSDAVITVPEEILEQTC